MFFYPQIHNLPKNAKLLGIVVKCLFVSLLARQKRSKSMLFFENLAQRSNKKWIHGLCMNRKLFLLFSSSRIKVTSWHLSGLEVENNVITLYTTQLHQELCVCLCVALCSSNWNHYIIIVVIPTYTQPVWFYTWLTCLLLLMMASE